MCRPRFSNSWRIASMAAGARGSVYAASAPAWAKLTGLVVSWLISLAMALIAGRGPATHPSRQPVIANVLASPLNVSVRSISRLSSAAKLTNSAGP